MHHGEGGGVTPSINPTGIIVTSQPPEHQVLIDLFEPPSSRLS